MFISFVLKSLLNLDYTLEDCLFLRGVNNTLLMAGLESLVKKSSRREPNLIVVDDGSGA